VNALFDQLEIDFEGRFRVGSLSEAMEIFETAGDRWNESPLPEGWLEVGDGSTRMVYLSPSGVAYKICKEYWEDYPSANAYEFQNFREISERKLLPEGWFVPKATLFTFNAFYTQFDNRATEPTKQWGTVDVLACEYIPGDDGTLTDDEVDVVFARVGLYDPTQWNAKVHGYTGEFFIIDAGESVQNWPEAAAV
jgi:hypothetical protein